MLYTLLDANWKSAKTSEKLLNLSQTAFAEVLLKQLNPKQLKIDEVLLNLLNPNQIFVAVHNHWFWLNCREGNTFGLFRTWTLT